MVGTGRARHGAIIVKGGSVLSVGINKSRTHDSWINDRPRNQCSIHAEISAIRSAGNVSGATLYVCRVNKLNELRLSAPCTNCQDYIEMSGIRKVVYS